MPALYVDTSALVKRYVGEVGTIWVRRALARPVRQGIYTALLPQPEALSALPGVPLRPSVRAPLPAGRRGGARARGPSYARDRERRPLQRR